MARHGLWTVALLLTAAACQAAGTIRPADLRCEYQVCPLAVECDRPRLSWVCAAAGGAGTTQPADAPRGLRQTAYRLLVASSPELLGRDQGDLWDSGKVASEESLHIEYAGQPLPAGRQVWWKVRLTDQAGQDSAWSEVAGWTMGLLRPADWQAQWIQADPKPPSRLNDCSWVWHGPPPDGALYPPGTRFFRRSLELPAQARVRSAQFFLAADNEGTLWVNGKQAVQSRDWQTLVVAEIGSLLRPGRNVLAIRAVNTTERANPAGLLGKLVLRLGDGTETVVPIDARWKSHDALQSKWEWVEFDDSAWPAAVEVRKYRQAPWTDGPAEPASAAMPIFRRHLDLPADKPVRRALLYACGLGQHELRLNGQKVGRSSIEPSWSNYRKTCYYTAHDVTGLLRPGANAVGAMLGNGMYNVVGGRYVKFRGSFGPPKLICRLDIEHADGTRTIVASDERWKWAAGPITFSCTFGGEDYDASQEPSGWDVGGFDDSAWSGAKAVDGPGGTLRAESVQPVQGLIQYRPVKATRIEPDVWVYDLGQNFSGWPRISVRGPAGATVKLTPGELLEADGRISQRSSGGPMWFSYTLKGDASGETWAPRFTYYGFRYVQVEGAVPADSAEAKAATPPAPTIIDRLEGEFLYTAAPVVGRFESSNATLNRIHWLINAAILSNFKSVLTDCPHREKLGWLEVSHLLADSLAYNYDAARFYHKICRDMRESQLPNGLVPDIAPEFTVFSGGFRDSPEWGSACVVNPWMLWQTYGDRRALEDNYQTMTRYTDYLASRANRDGIIAFGLGDWYDIGPKGPGPSQLTSLGVTGTAMLFNNLSILERTARILGKGAEADQFARRAAATRAAFQKAFYHADRGAYDRGSQAANAIPLALNLADPADRPAVLQTLVRDIRANQDRVTAGDVGFVYLVRALADNGQGHVLYDMMMQDRGPGYICQLKKGSTALTEAWDSNPGSSQNHCMLGHAEEWLYRGLGGIKLDPAAPAFKHFILRPDTPKDLEWVNVSYTSPRGPIVSRWKQSPPAGGGPGRFTWSISVPPNTSATVFVPARNAAGVSENGKPAAQAAGLKFVRMDGGFAVFQAGSGAYTLEAARD